MSSHFGEKAVHWRWLCPVSRHPAHQCQWSPAGAGKHGDEGAGVTRTEHEGARTAAHSRPPTTINCCSIHCYSQWESCNRNQGPALQCCMSCSAAVTRDTTVKSAQARHNLQVSVIIRFHKKRDSHKTCHSMSMYLSSWKLKTQV